VSSQIRQPTFIIISNWESFLLCASQVLCSTPLNISNVILGCLKTRRPVITDSFTSTGLDGLGIYLEISLLQPCNRGIQQLLTLFDIPTDREIYIKISRGNTPCVFGLFPFGNLWIQEGQCNRLRRTWIQNLILWNAFWLWLSKGLSASFLLVRRLPRTDPTSYTLDNS
jgi:hypothetical protein